MTDNAKIPGKCPAAFNVQRNRQVVETYVLTVGSSVNIMLNLP